MTGLSLTQFLILQLLAEAPSSIGELWQRYREREPLPFLGDTMFLRIVDDIGHTSVPILERTRVNSNRPFGDRVAVTDAARDVLSGTTDWLALHPPLRWVGGVPIDAGHPVWRWDEERRDVLQA